MSGYEVGDDDRVTRLDGLPQSSIGAPLPTILSDEHSVVVAYVCVAIEEGWNDTTARVVGPKTEDEPIALVSFRPYYAYSFGPPNDEAFSGHPLAERGLEPYGSFEVRPSSWIRKLERMNSVHPYHDPTSFERLRHFVLSFHDSTFECVARAFEVETHTGSIHSMIARMTALLA